MARTAYNYDSLGGILYGIFYGLTIAFFPIVARKIGADSTQMALLTTTSFIGALFTFFWAHYSSDKKKMPFLVRIKSIARILIFAMVLAVNPTIFVIIVLFYWFFEMAGTPAYISIVKEIYSEEHRGRVLGYVRVEMALAVIAASYMGGILLDRISYRYVFPLGTIFGLLALASFRRIAVESDNQLQEKKQRPFSLFKTVKIFKKDRRFFRYEVIYFIFGFANIMVLPLYPIFLVDNLHVSNALVGRLAALFSLFWLGSYLFWGQFIDRKDPLRALYMIMVLMSLVPGLYSIASSIWYAALATIFSGISSGGLELSRVTYITKIANHEQVQTYWGVDYTLMGARGIIAPFVGIGMMHLLGLQAVFFLSFVAILTCFLAMRYFTISEPSALQMKVDEAV